MKRHQNLFRGERGDEGREGRGQGVPAPVKSEEQTTNDKVLLVEGVACATWYRTVEYSPL